MTTTGAGTQTTVAVVSVAGGLSKDELDNLEETGRRVVARLNRIFNDSKVNTTWTFHSLGALPVDGDLTKYDDDRRVFNDTTYWTAFNDFAQRPKYDQVIGLCSEVLESSSFNRRNELLGVGIITVKEASAYTPPGVTIDGYLMYLFMCVHLCLKFPGPNPRPTDATPPLPWVAEHDERAYCLFDVCSDPDDLTRCLRSPSLVHCEDRLTKAGAPDEEVAAYERVLREAGHRDLFQYAVKTAGRSGLSFVGGVAVAFVTNVVATEYPRIAIFLALIVLAFGALLAIPAIPRRGGPVASAAPTKALTLIVAWLVAGLIVAAAIGFVLVFEMPGLPSESR